MALGGGQGVGVGKDGARIRRLGWEWEGGDGWRGWGGFRRGTGGWGGVGRTAPYCIGCTSLRLVLTQNLLILDEVR